MIDNSRPLLAALNDSSKFRKRIYLNLLDDLEISNGQDVKTIAKKIENKNFDQSVKEKIIKGIEEIDLSWYKSELRRLEKKGIKYAAFYDDGYPPILTEIEDPPLGVYIRGDFPVQKDRVAVVGTRESPEERRAAAFKIGQFLVEEDYVVVSGLANGIDEEAHKGAIDESGYTVGVLPGSIEKIRPSSNKELGKRMTEHGALLAEVSDKAGFGKWRYLERNRITSGMSKAVIVVASRDEGGTVNQAEIALRENRPVFMYAPDGVGDFSPRVLEKKGAKLFKDLDDLGDYLDELSNHFSGNYQARLSQH